MAAIIATMASGREILRPCVCARNRNSFVGDPRSPRSFAGIRKFLGYLAGRLQIGVND